MMKENDKMLEIKGLRVLFPVRKKWLPAVDGVNLNIRSGEITGVVGESGSGKSVMSQSILRLRDYDTAVRYEGEILFEGIDLLKQPLAKMRDIRGNRISVIFQDPLTSLSPVHTVGNQLSEVLVLHKKMSKQEAKERAVQMLKVTGIPNPENCMRQYPYELSGGMQQRVMIAMALACEPKLLIADEPTTALDVTIQAQVLEMMKGLREKYNTSMLMITHDLGIVAEICDKVSVIYAGHVIEHGTLVDIFKNTRHPYTEGLFNSLPNLENRTAELKPIKGLMPDPSNLPKGCAFCPRCDYAMEICKTEKPKRVYRNDTHYVECHLYNEDNIQEGKVSIR